MIAPSPDVFAAAALNTLGLESRTSGYWFHKIQVFLFSTIASHNFIDRTRVFYSFIGMEWRRFSFQVLWKMNLLSL